MGIVHERYDHAHNHNDIALIKLHEPVDLTNQYIKAICLPTPNESFDNHVCTATGWGATHTGGAGTRYLLQVDLPIISNDRCRYYLGSRAVFDSNICAGYSQG